MEILKKIYKFIASMKFAILLLIVVAVACMIGSFVPQGEMFEQYRSAYSERTAAFILAFHLDDVFRSWWFIALVSLLCLSVLFCNLTRVRTLIQQTKYAADPARTVSLAPVASAEGISDPEPALKRLRFYHPARTIVGEKEVLFAYRNRLGFWGAWICHIGIILIVLGYALGQMTLFSAEVYGTPGQTKPIENTPYEITIDDFRTERSETGFVEQYVSSVTVRNNETGETQSGTSSVNHPAVLEGYKLYQTASGYAVRVTIAEDGVPFESADLCAGEELTIEFLPGFSLYLNAYEPDHNGKAAYQILFFYQGQHMDVGTNYFSPGAVIDLAPYTIMLSEPIEYTLLRVKKDSYSWLVLIGAFLTIAGLFLALYVVPETVWAVRTDGDTWTINGRSKKLAPLFVEQFERAIKGGSGKEEPVS